MARILFVQSENRAWNLGEELGSSGYEIVGVARNHKDAIAEIERTRPDLVLVDAMLGTDFDGISTAEAIHRDFHLPVMFLVTEDDRERLQQSEVTLPFGYVLMPDQSESVAGQTPSMEASPATEDITELKRKNALQAERERVATFAANIGVALTRGGNLRSKLELCAEAMVRDLQAGIVSLWTVTGEQTLMLQAARGVQNHIPVPVDGIPVGKFRIGAIAENETPMMLDLVSSEPGGMDRKWARDAGMVAFAGYPLMSNGRTVGVMALYSGTPLTRSTLVAMASVADGIAQAIDRVRTEEALKESEERYRDLVENSADLIFTHTTDGTILSVNRAMLRTVGASNAQEVVGRSIVDFIVPRFRDRFDTYLDAVRKDGHSSGLWSTKMLNNQERVLEYTSSLRTEGTGLPIVRGRAIDVTERIIAEKALRESEKRFRILFENSLGFICTHDLDGKILGVNPATARGVGYTAEEIIGRNLRDIVSPGYVPQIPGYLDRIVKEKVVSGLMVLRAKDGSERIWEYRNCLFEENKAERYVIAYAQDITERRKIEQAKDELVSIVAHELRSPLTSIRGSLEYMSQRMSNSLPENANKLVSMAYRSTERLVRLINDLLDIDKIESGKASFEMKRQDLIPLIQQSMEAMQPFADQFQVELKIQNILPQAYAAVDSDRLLQVMTNLLSNACKFSPAGKPVEVSVARNGNFIRVAIRDQGPGIPEDFRGDLFKKFSQANHQKGGSGLGLNITKAIVDKLGGILGFETRTGQGTTFYFDLPEAQD